MIYNTSRYTGREECRLIIVITMDTIQRAGLGGREGGRKGEVEEGRTLPEPHLQPTTKSALPSFVREGESTTSWFP